MMQDVAAVSTMQFAVKLLIGQPYLGIDNSELDT